MTIRQKLLYGMAFALLLCVAFVVAISVWQSRQNIEHYWLGEALPAHIRAIAREVERDLKGGITASEMLADNSLLHGWIRRGEPADEWPLQQAFLGAIAARQKADSAHFVSSVT